MTALTAPPLLNAPTRAAASAAADEDVVCFGLGPVDVTVRCDRRAVISDLQSFYPPASGDGRPVIRIHARRERWRPRRYQIDADAAPAYRQVPGASLLPYIEWAINGRVTDRCRTNLMVHAATLAWHGRGVVLAAASGSGKSTLAATLLARGWSYLCDEFAMIDLKTRRLQPLPRAICVKAGSFAAVGALGLPLRRDHHHTKAFKGEVGYIAPADLGPGAVQHTPVPIRAVVFPRYLPGATLRLEPLPPAEAVMELATHAFNRQWLGHRATALLADVVREAVCLRLTHSDAHAAGAALERVMDDA